MTLALSVNDVFRRSATLYYKLEVFRNIQKKQDYRVMLPLIHLSRPDAFQSVGNDSYEQSPHEQLGPF